MKATLCFLIALFQLTQTFAQVAETKNVSIDSEIVASAVQKSKQELIDIVGEAESKKMVPMGIDYEEVTVKNDQGVSKHNGRMLYVMWGYNRAWHTDTDTTFHTENGTFTIHDAKGEDRPSSGIMTYIDPSKFTQPQYVFRIGYMLNSKIAVEIGQDHMKWVYDPSTKYDISGNYDKNVWINDQQVSFEEAKAQKNGSFIMLEHTDGYNYINASGVYTEPLFTSKNNRFRFDLSAGAGGGILVPKTFTRIRDTDDGQWRGLDNKFKVAGWGAHVDTRLKLSYRFKSAKEVFIFGSAKGMVGKIEKAHFLGSPSEYISQDPIYSFQVFAGAGVAVPIFQGKKK